MGITKIVVTGGPCAGKSTAMSRIQKHFTKLGYTVLFISESATELINGGIAPWSVPSNLEFQRCIMRFQLEKERLFEETAKRMGAEKLLIVCDRGAIDNKSYMSEEEFGQVLSSVGISEVELRDGYDAVFHLVTAAKGAVEFYTTANNTARTETPEEASAIDDRLISAWTGHPHLRLIDNSTDFEDKMRRLLGEISAFLGEPEPFEIERKYLIEMPDLDWLRSDPHCQRVEIIQTYLPAPEGDEIRVRQRGLDGSYIYFRTIKRRVSPVKRIEIEERISKDEYLRLLMDADPTKRVIRKDRYCLTYKNQYFEIDVYPFWQDKAIMELELSREDAPIDLPERINIIREVTDDPDYRNSALARIDR